MPAAGPNPGTNPSAGRRQSSTPYARRLARDRQLQLAAISGSGPNGRILARDVVGHAPPEMRTAASVAQIALQPATTAAATAREIAPPPDALAIGIEMASVNSLVEQLKSIHAGASADDLCLKAAAMAMIHATGFNRHGDRLLLIDNGRHIEMVGLAGATLGAIAKMRRPEADGRALGLAVSFLAHAGIRPAATRLVGSTAARLVIGKADGGSAAECLLSYDPERLDEAAAADFLHSFKALLETPLRILV